MPDENTPGSSYLAALKKSGAPAAAAPAREAEGEFNDLSNFSLSPPATLLPPGNPRSANPEKRRSPRYRCQGSAHLRELVTGSATWATFTDISLHGIYVEAMSTYRAGARLALTLEVNGFRVEARGEVRVVYPGLGMGISFVTMADEGRERLRLLLKSLSQPSVILRPPSVQETPAIPTADSVPSLPDPAAALRALVLFFDQRHILSRDEFLRILKKSQTSGS
jgi:hypothetical protein